MSRCAHRNVVYKEQAETWLAWECFEREPEDDGYAADPFPTGRIEVECMDCTKTWQFGPKAKLPKWVEIIQEQVKNHSWRHRGE